MKIRNDYKFWFIVGVKPIYNMPNLPTARVMWQAKHNLTTGVKRLITAGGAHHTMLKYDVEAGQMRDYALISGIEYIHISKLWHKSTLPGF